MEKVQNSKLMEGATGAKLSTWDMLISSSGGESFLTFLSRRKKESRSICWWASTSSWEIPFNVEATIRKWWWSSNPSMALSNIITLKTLRLWQRWTFSKANAKSRKKEKMLKKCKKNLRFFLRKENKKERCYLRLHLFSFKLTWITSSSLSTTVKNDVVFLLFLQTLLFHFKLLQSCLIVSTNVSQRWIWWIMIHERIFLVRKNMKRKNIHGVFNNLWKILLDFRRNIKRFPSELRHKKNIFFFQTFKIIYLNQSKEHVKNFDCRKLVIAFIIWILFLLYI